MAMNMCLLVLMSLAVLASADNKGTWLFSSMNKAPASPPAPTDPCALIVYNMMDCMDFLILNQPSDNKPSTSCCTGFESVLAVSPLCVCEAVKTASAMGLELNMTKAAKLPSLCGATTFDKSICKAKTAAPPQRSSMAPSPAAREKKAPTTAAAAETVSGSYSLNTVASGMLAGVLGVMVSFYLA